MAIAILLAGVILLVCILIPLIIGVIVLVTLRSRRKASHPSPAVPPSEEPSETGSCSLSQILKDYRLRCGMTQELVAEKLEVSRQAVSKWENGTSDPSTANLIALAHLYGVDPGELLKNIQG